MRVESEIMVVWTAVTTGCNVLCNITVKLAANVAHVRRSHFTHSYSLSFFPPADSVRVLSAMCEITQNIFFCVLRNLSRCSQP